MGSPQFYISVYESPLILEQIWRFVPDFHFDFEMENLGLAAGRPEICKEAAEAGLLLWLVAKRLKVKDGMFDNKIYYENWRDRILEVIFYDDIS